MKAVLFDLDGTLLDTLQDLTDATNHTLRHFGSPEKTAAQTPLFILNFFEKTSAGFCIITAIIPAIIKGRRILSKNLQTKNISNPTTET